jgi:flagellar hook-associated protein 3 FlgL
MRISDRYQQLETLRQLRAQAGQLSRAQEEVASGRRVRTMSDAPLDAPAIMRIDGTLRDIEQYQRNGTEATTRLSTQDAVLTATAKLLDQAKQLALTGATQSTDGPLRQQALAQVKQIFDQIVSLGNTQLGGEYLFAGGRTEAPPFRADGVYLGDATVRQTEIDSGLVVDVGTTGDRAFGSSIQALQGLLQQLQTGDRASIESAASTLDGAHQDVLTLQADLGSRLAEVRDTGTYLGRRSAALLDQREKLRDADPTESLVKVASMQSAMERAYAVLSKVLSTHLTDFLR